MFALSLALKMRAFGTPKMANWNLQLGFHLFDLMSNSYSDSINSQYSQFRLTINSHEHRLAGCISNSIISGANIQSFIAFSTHGERAIYDIAIFCPGNGWFRVTISSTSKIHWLALIHCHVCRYVSDVWWI